MDEFSEDNDAAEREPDSDGIDEIAPIPAPLADDAPAGAGAPNTAAAGDSAPSDDAPPSGAGDDEPARGSAEEQAEQPVEEPAAPGAADGAMPAPGGDAVTPWAAAATAPPTPPVDLRPAFDIARGDVVSEARGFRVGRTTFIAVAVVMLLGVLGIAGVAYATYDLSQDYDGRILPGAKIAGVDVGGMDRDEAIAAVRAQVLPELTRDVAVVWEDTTWTTTPKKLGAHANARAAVEAALTSSGETTFFDKARMRMFGHRLQFRRDVAIRYPYKGAKGFIAGIASSFDRDARDASIDYSSGWVEIVDATRGREVRQGPSVAALRDALVSGGDESELEVRVIEPEVTADAFRRVLLVHIGDNKLYLYSDGEIVRQWKVATGQPEYMTPTGVFHVTEKRYLPTWVNPAPTTWGASMPASIPPGPANPLGVRALNWSAPAIRFHGTSATYSLGYNASHGCVRLSNDEVVELYDMIDVGTPIVSIVHGSLKPLYSSASASTPQAEQSAD